MIDVNFRVSTYTSAQLTTFVSPLRWQSKTRTQCPVARAVRGVRFMGCDIHLFTEKLVDGQWVSADKFVRWDSLYKNFVPDDDKPEYCLESVYEGRNYRLFAILANVRNEYDIRPITDPRGLPLDMSPEVQSEVKSWEGGWVFGHSYLTLRELEEFDWAGKSFEIHGWVSAWEYRELKAEGRPNSWCRWVDGAEVKRVKQDEMELLIAADSNLDGIYTKMKWHETYAGAACDFLERTLPRLREMAAGDPDVIRIVFWFDN